MPKIVEGNLTFTFPNAWTAAQYDAWTFYRKQFQSSCGGTKAVDIVALQPTQCTWLIEVKDYRNHARTKPSELSVEVAYKVRDTLAGIVAASANATDIAEQTFAQSILATHSFHIVLHLEQPQKHSKLFPRAIDPAYITQQLRQMLKAIAARPVVVECNAMQSLPWNVV